MPVPSLPTLALILLSLSGGFAAAQIPAIKAVAAPNLPDDPHVLHGVNAGATISGVHDSITGWTTLFTPAIGYSFGDHFNIDANIPIYFFRLAESRSARPRPDAELVAQRGELGDVVVGLHGLFAPRLADTQLNGLFTIPTGDSLYGLSTGRVTFDLSSRFEHTFGKLTPNIEIGAGDSSTLVNRLVTKNYTSLGPLAHFQTGLSVDLPHGLSFETDAYEQLPIGDQKTYGPSRNGKATVVTGHNITEDNGFTNSLDLPFERHTTLSGYYNRSLRIHTDTVAIGITYVLRGSPPPTPSDVDLDDIFR